MANSGASTSANPGHGDARQLRRHESLHFEDGDLVIAAPNEEATATVFKAHTSASGQLRPELRNALSSESPEGESYDATPLVHLDDEAGYVAERIEGFYEFGCVTNLLL